MFQETGKGARKGIKLDFKAIEIVQPSLEIVKQVESKLNFPVWFNADIIVGPGGGDPVDADRFLELSAQYFPGSTTFLPLTLITISFLQEPPSVQDLPLVLDFLDTTPMTS